MRDMIWGYLGKILFSCFLGAAAWQDIRRKAIDVRLYVWFGSIAVIAVIFSIFNGTGRIMDMVAGAALGGILLLLSRATDGAVGDGDGWFFLIGGVYLGFRKNVELLMDGLLVCGGVCMILWGIGMVTGKSMKKCTVPFLPFLVPVWIGMIGL